MKFLLAALLSLLCFSSVAGPGRAAPADYFRITVVDADTGRGVPLVELKTTNAVTFYTDSNGIAAINDPDLLGHSVWFEVKSHGYEYPADGFGYRGKALEVKAGGAGKDHAASGQHRRAAVPDHRRGPLRGQRQSGRGGSHSAAADGRTGDGAGHGDGDAV